jgi:hypothetical protein
MSQLEGPSPVQLRAAAVTQKRETKRRTRGDFLGSVSGTFVQLLSEEAGMSHNV